MSPELIAIAQMLFLLLVVWLAFALLAAVRS